MAMEAYIETGRLILRELLPTDAEGMFELDSDAEVHRFLGNQPVKTIEESRETISVIRQQYIDFNIGRWAVIDKATGNFMGWAGLKFMTDTRNGHRNFHDVGYRLIKRYWGKGYATEAAIASIKYGFDGLELDEIYGMADVDNIASQKALQKSGLIYIENFELNGTPHCWFKITRLP
ncbi:GNAT family N-acetyltransferase [Mucilaginibacter sp. FT3.2]|uniref:GNAT family N-acetyltransferase n=1 Tax=Mucilaginibacter sp. FT3.2 TaxID=2723090 RepID=UPI0017E8EF7F|nr:GNAT family N-acetyltransferase [Mucilaginibacter sp. FT3.2]MBB6231683.1 RimJ/RimL family protein N-acetyltransferase [Mucilaginibacter sp. FT3.2]